MYRGKLVEAEDNMNCQLSDITVTYRDGKAAQLENVFIRGYQLHASIDDRVLHIINFFSSKIRFLILPDMLKNAPMLKNLSRGGASRGRGGPPRGGRGGGGGGGFRGGYPITNNLW